MAPRAFWKGYLKLSLGTLPGRDDAGGQQKRKVRFHTHNR